MSFIHLFKYIFIHIILMTYIYIILIYNKFTIKVKTETNKEQYEYNK